MYMDDSSSESGGSDLGENSPFAKYRHTQVLGRSERLPASQDTSWIGARVSPITIPTLDDDDDTLLMLNRHYGDGGGDSSSGSSNRQNINERSALLGKRRPRQRTRAEEPNQRWRLQTISHDVSIHGFLDWGRIVELLSGCHLLLIAIHDLYIWYLSYRLGLDVDVESWILPWLSPSTAVLTRFGALLPYQVLEFNQWWRMITFLFLPTSLADYVLVLWSWRILRRGGAKPTRRWCHIYLLAALTGLVWMLAFDLSGIAGAATWGTCGVICATGGAKPKQRFILFMTAICIIMLSLVEPNNSVMGPVGSSMFGWSFYGLGWSRVVSKMDKGAVKPKGFLQIFSGCILLKVWIIPLLFLAFWSPQSETT
jgi:hypothetical protein